MEECPAAVGNAGVRRTLPHAPIAQRRDTRLQIHFRRRSALEHNVDHTGDRVGTVLRSRTIAENFNALDHAGRNRVQIHRRLPASHRAVHVDQCRGVPTLAVHQHQHLIRTESAQRRRTHRIGTVADRCARKVHARRQRLNHLRRLGATGGFQVDRTEHIHRHR